VPTPEELAYALEVVRGRIATLIREREFTGKMLALLEEEARVLEEQLRALPRSEQPSRVNVVDSQAHAFATSQGRSKDPLVKAANKARLTLRELAKRVDMTPSHLSMARRGDRTIRESAAKKIQELTGFAATKANWPLGIVSGK
jgi:hypothetical protein